MKTLSNVTIKPSLLQRHLGTNHADKKNQDQSYFQWLAENVKRQRLAKTGLFHQKGAEIVKVSVKLDLLKKNVESKKYGMFKFLTTLDSAPNNEVCHEIIDHLSLLNAEVRHYFPYVTCCAYMTDPFSPANLPVGTGEQEELIDIQADQTAKTKHKDCFPINFRLSIASSYSTLASHAIPQLLIFPSTWECEQGFSALMTIKSTKQNRLVAPMHDFRCTVSKCMPRIDKLVENEQMQPLP